MAVRHTGAGMVLVNGRGEGGTTTLATGNAVRADDGLRAVGVNLDEEFAALAREIPIAAWPERRWTVATRRLFEAFGDLGLEPEATPKMGDPAKCTRCGKCVLGCQQGARWDARVYLREALARGARLETRCRVERLRTRNGRVTGVETRRGGRRVVIDADVVVLAAGGFGTAQILEASGVATDPGLFVDPVLCVAAPYPGAGQDAERPMPFVSRRGPVLLSPYFDWLSFFFAREWRRPAGDILSLMIKLADEPGGRVRADGTVDKTLTPRDQASLERAAETCRALFARLGVADERLFFGMLNAGHPGGTLALTTETAGAVRDPRLPACCWVADATLIPGPFGMPPILTIMALARRVARAIA